ncbi:FecCD family ABC transporter permease [Haloimpatiens lingqiaonensis]|uniref:FecCD family ABC transporter permease n=1 Tax=Haloimpatiens lingqiaonensis TaxID=1380675 RepID=UPI0010FD0AE2|nr:iron chelate uptake ABC transporter family permease subunit [Haloimpatiens lingqiaonensis]
MNFTEKKTHYNILFIILTVILFLLIIFCAALGAADINFFKSMKILFSKLPFINILIDTSNIKASESLIVLNIRLPRILMSIIIGIGLSIVGCSFQAIFKNPMADPYILGISSGSALGATVGIILNFSFLSKFLNSVIGISFFAFLGGILTTLFVYNIARVGKKLPTNTLLLSGVTMSFLLSSIISILMLFNRNQLEDIYMWTMGSVSSASWQELKIVVPIILIGSLIIISLSKDLNIMLTGDSTAESLGVNVEKVKKIILITSSLIVASCVSVTGIIGFVGLIIPHITRLIVGPDHKILFPFSALFGAIFLTITDTLARTLINPSEIPVGVITALFGAPYFLYLLYQNKKKVL